MEHNAEGPLNSPSVSLTYLDTVYALVAVQRATSHQFNIGHDHINWAIELDSRLQDGMPERLQVCIPRYHLRSRVVYGPPPAFQPDGVPPPPGPPGPQAESTNTIHSFPPAPVSLAPPVSHFDAGLLNAMVENIENSTRPSASTLVAAGPVSPPDVHLETGILIAMNENIDDPIRSSAATPVADQMATPPSNSNDQNDDVMSMGLGDDNYDGASGSTSHNTADTDGDSAIDRNDDDSTSPSNDADGEVCPRCNIVHTPEPRTKDDDEFDYWSLQRQYEVLGESMEDYLEH